MSPSFVNDKSHPVRIKDSDGTLRRLVPGQVVEADGKFADNLEAAGLPSADSDHARAWDEKRAAGTTDGPASRMAAKLLLGPIRVAGRLAAAAPLRRVVGDDSAPLGPPSGTITTKAEAASKSEREREAFADHEALPGEEIPHAGTPNPNLPLAGDVSSDEIHNAQVKNAELAEAVAHEVLDEAADSNVEDHFRAGAPSAPVETELRGDGEEPSQGPTPGEGDAGQPPVGGEPSPPEPPPHESV